MADGDRKEERSGERSRTPAQARRASRRERVAQARSQKAPPKSQGGERAPRAGIGQFVRECAAELRKVQSATGDAWSEMMRGADAAFKGMQDAFERARSKFDKK